MYAWPCREATRTPTLAQYRTRPPPPLRSPAFAQILDHVSGLGLSINAVEAAGSDWAKLKYGARRGVPLLLYQRVFAELGCATPRVHLHSTCICGTCRAPTCMCVGALPLALFHLALSAVRCQVDYQRPGRRIKASTLGRQPPVRRQRKQGEVAGPVSGWPCAVRRGAEGERRAQGVGGVAGAHSEAFRTHCARSLSLAHSLRWAAQSAAQSWGPSLSGGVP